MFGRVISTVLTAEGLAGVIMYSSAISVGLLVGWNEELDRKESIAWRDSYINWLEGRLKREKDEKNALKEELEKVTEED